ncbi:MAG: hypothetical protein IIA17_07755 [candidate division Zixibacteria bacterium]|nr:hypothetical protein [candidate division Zixibacteria bacterium]
MKCKLGQLLFAFVFCLFTGAVTISGSSDNKQRTFSKAALGASAAATTNYDTITTGVISLAVAVNGKFGGGDSAGLSGVRMDYYSNTLECDTVDSIPGDTRKYLYDGSVIVGRIFSGDTILSNSIYHSQSDSSSIIYQLSSESAVTTDEVFQVWQSGTMTNYDSSIGFLCTYYAPQMTKTWDFGTGKVWQADQQFITKELKVWSLDSLALSDLVIGEVIDWDIPSDSGVRNSGETDGSRNLLYCFGAEFNQDSSVECQDNDLRYGGMSYGYYKRYAADFDSLAWFVLDSVPYGGYHEANTRYVDSGWDDNQLYQNMSETSGLRAWSHSHSDSQQVNLHSVLTYEFQIDINPGDTLVFYSIMATVRNSDEESFQTGSSRIKELADKGQNFIRYFGCCHNLRGDLNTDGKDADVVDLAFIVQRIFHGGPPPTCAGEGDVNADGSPTDIVDLTFLVDVIFRGGPPPYSCGEEPCDTFECHD